MKMMKESRAQPKSQKQQGAEMNRKKTTWNIRTYLHACMHAYIHTDTYTQR